MYDHDREDKDKLIEAFTQDSQSYNTKTILRMWSMSESEHAELKECVGLRAQQRDSRAACGSRAAQFEDLTVDELIDVPTYKEMKRASRQRLEK